MAGQPNTQQATAEEGGATQRRLPPEAREKKIVAGAIAFFARHGFEATTRHLKSRAKGKRLDFDQVLASAAYYWRVKFHEPEVYARLAEQEQMSLLESSDDSSL